MPTLDQYYNRFNPAQHYESHLFRAGYVLQSAELNEVQSALQWRTQGIGDALFKDGDVVRDAKLIVNVTTGVATGESGVIYLKGAVRGVPARTFTVPAIGTISVGITLIETWVTELEDPALRDPAVGVRNYQEPGAGRLRLEPRWSYAGETGVNAPVGEFYPIYTVVDGVVTPKQPPPNIDVVSAAIAVYDRDNSGGNYVISGYRVTAVPSITNGIQSVLVSSGRARVFGFPIEHVADSRLNRTADPDLRRISAEPHLADNSGLQRIDLD